jgi:hypothetical protein
MIADRNDKANLHHDKAALAEHTLHELVDRAQAQLGDQLVAALVFGSAANNQLRATSDVNLMLVLKTFDQQRIDSLRDSVRLARALVDLHVMFILQSELPSAAKTFAMKFSDITHRHRLLFGENCLVNLGITREDLVANMRQVLLNFQLRSREHYVTSSLREEQMVHWIADAAGPLRSCAAALREIRGQAYLPAKQALEELARETGRVYLLEAVQAMSVAREQVFLPPGTASSVLMNLLELAHFINEQL